MNNAAQKVTRIDKDAWDIATELANDTAYLFVTSSARASATVQRMLNLRRWTLSLNDW